MSVVSTGGRRGFARMTPLSVRGIVDGPVNVSGHGPASLRGFDKPGPTRRIRGGAQMSDILDDAVERLEWDERKEEDTPVKRWKQLTRRTALTGGAAGIAATILAACGGSSSSSSSTAASGSSSSASSIFGSSQSYKFTLVNHVTTNTFFTPTQNGAADACKLLGCSYQWTGLADQQRLRDGQLDEQRDQRRRQRDRRLAGRPEGVQRADEYGARARGSRSSRTTRTRSTRRPRRSPTRGSPTSGRTCSCRVRRWASTSPRWCRPATWRCSSPRRVR